MEKGNAQPSIMGMFYKPNEQFERVRKKPIFWKPFVFVTILIAISTLLVAMSMTPENLMFDSSMAKEELELLTKFTQVTTVMIGIISSIAGVFISAAITFLIVKIARKGATFKQILSMTVFIMVVTSVGMVLNTVLQFLLDGPPGVYVTSLAGLLNSESAVLSGIEIFSIWGLVLTALGLHVVGQLSKKVAWTLTILIFVGGIGIAMIGSVLQGTLGI